MASHWAFPVSLWDPCLHVVTPHPGSRTVRRLPRIPGIQPGTATRSLKQRGADWLHGAAMITEAASNYLSKIIAVSDREAGRGWDEWGCPAGDSTHIANRLNPPRCTSSGTGRMQLGYCWATVFDGGPTSAQHTTALLLPKTLLNLVLVCWMRSNVTHILCLVWRMWLVANTNVWECTTPALRII